MPGWEWDVNELERRLLPGQDADPARDDEVGSEALPEKCQAAGVDVEAQPGWAHPMWRQGLPGTFEVGGGALSRRKPGRRAVSRETGSGRDGEEKPRSEEAAGGRGRARAGAVDAEAAVVGAEGGGSWGRGGAAGVDARRSSGWRR